MNITKQTCIFLKKNKILKSFLLSVLQTNISSRNRKDKLVYNKAKKRF